MPGFASLHHSGYQSGMPSPRKSLLFAAVLGTCLLPAAPTAGAASYTSCKPVVNPYAGSRYDGVNLSSIRVLNGSCSGARVVAKGAHRKALGLTPSASPIRRFFWGGWRVKGDLRGDSDRYLAVKGSKRVRWRF